MLDDRGRGRRRVVLREIVARAQVRGEVRRRIDDALPLEGRRRVEPPAPRPAPVLQERPAEAELHPAPLVAQDRQELAHQQEAVARDQRAMPSGRSKDEAARSVASKCKTARRGAGLRGVLDRTDLDQRGVDGELRDIDPDTAAEQAGPHPAGDDHRVAVYPATLRHDAGDPATVQNETAHGTGFVNADPVTPRGLGEGRDGKLRLDARIARLIEPAGHSLRLRHVECRQIRRGEQPRLAGQRTGGLEPGLFGGQFAGIRAKMDQTARIIADPVMADLRRKGAPQVLRPLGQGQLVGMQAKRRDPAKGAAALLGRDKALLAHRDASPPATQPPRGCKARNPGADHDGIHPGRQVAVGFDPLRPGGTLQVR